MAQVVDALVVTLGLDPSNFTKGQKEAAASFLKTRDAAKKAGSDIEESGKKAAEFISVLRREVMGLFAAFTAGRSLKDFIADLTASDAALGRLAQNLNTTPGTLSVWSQAVKRLGGSAEGAQNAFRSLTNSLQELRFTGNTGILQWLYKLQAASGVQFNFAKPAEKQLLDIAEALSRVYKKSPEAANFLGAQLGLDQGTINFLVQGRRIVEEQLEAQRKLGAATWTSVEAAQKLTTAWEDATTAFKDYVRVATGPFMAAMTWTTEQITWIITKLRDFHQGWLIVWKAVVKIVTDAFDGFKSQYEKTLDGWIDATKKSGSRILSAFKEAFKGVFEWLSDRFGEFSIFGFHPFGGGSGGSAGGGRGGAAQGGPLSSAPPIRVPPATGGAIRSDEAGRGSQRLGVGARAARGNLARNQREAYQAAREAGLTDTAARALVANFSGESLADPRNHHWDVHHMSQGIGQWDPQRAEAIKRQFGKYPKDMSVAEQTRAAIWEINHNPRFRQTRAALYGGGSAQSMIGALVRNYEVPANPGAAIAQRQRFFNGLGNLSAPTAAVGGALPFFAQTLGAPGVAGATNNNTSTTNSTSNTNNVGNVNVYMPSGSNAVEVAQGIGRAIEQNAFTGHANYGPA